MRKIKHYPDDSFAFHKKVVESKRDKGQDSPIAEIKKNEHQIQAAFQDYDRRFANDNLVKATAINISDELKGYLRSLYSSSLKAFRDLKFYLTTDNGRTYNICPLCTIDISGTLDHILPKEEFAEFADHPKNLMPCCSTCNSKKNDRWRENGKLLYLNLYIDDIPEIQYLFVKVTLCNNSPQITFELRNDNGIPGDLYERIRSHYTKLELCKRFSEATGNYIGEIQDQIQSLLEMQNDKEFIKEMISKEAVNSFKRNGKNFWKAILLKEISENDDLFDLVAK
jgi:hypothetical protein